MDCDEWFEQISAAADGELDGAARGRLDDHLGRCSGCRTLAERFVAMRRSMLVTVAAPVPDLTAAIVHRHHDHAHPARQLRRRAGAVFAGIAAIVLLFVALAGGTAPSTPGEHPGERAAGSELVQIIEAADAGFRAPSVAVDVGATVGWRNDSPTEHHLVREGPGAHSVTDLQPGQTDVATFDEPGTYDYYCNVHHEVAGKVLVRS